MPTVTLRPGLDLAYTEAGPAQAPALLLITGLGGLKEGWFRQVPAFSRDHRVIAYDHRGMGGSTFVDEPLAMSDLARDGTLLLDRLGVGRAHVWGVSMGGKVAQELALGWPDRVDRLVLENTSAGERHRVDRGDAVLRRARGATAQVWMDEIVPRLFGPKYVAANEKSLWAFARSRERHPSDLAVMARQWEAYEAFDSWDRLPALAHPTLVLVGGQDAMCDPENGMRLAERIPNARLHVVADGGHSVHIECPDEVNRVVAAFLAGTDGPP